MTEPSRYDLVHRRSRLRFRRRPAPAGAAPGTLMVQPDAGETEIRVLACNVERVLEESIADLARLTELVDQWSVVWIDVVGLGDEDRLRKLAQTFGVHRLALEDAVNLGQRAKVETYGDELFLVVRMPVTGSTRGTEQVSLFLRPGLLITLQERAGDCFGLVRDRIRSGQSRIRERGSDYLAYALIDAVIDAYFPILESVAGELDELEDEVFGDPDQQTLARIHALKRDLVSLRKVIWPHRDMLHAIQRDGGDHFKDETLLYTRDAYDHVLRIMDLTEALREATADLKGTYLSIVSNRMNEVMKVLTIVATIFIPLSFVAGVYGMNFDPSVSNWNMPELGWRFGYPLALLIMALVAAGMLIFIRRRRWL